MSEQLPEHELELMKLFDTDLSQQERERLIEQLQDYHLHLE